MFLLGIKNSIEMSNVGRLISSGKKTVKHASTVNLLCSAHSKKSGNTHYQI